MPPRSFARAAGTALTTAVLLVGSAVTAAGASAAEPGPPVLPHGLLHSSGPSHGVVFTEPGGRKWQ